MKEPGPQDIILKNKMKNSDVTFNFWKWWKG